MTQQPGASGHEPMLDDVLNEFAAALDDTSASYALLRQWSARYPAYAEQLAEHAAAEALLRHSPASQDNPDEDRLLQAGHDAARGALERARAERSAVARPRAPLPGLMARARDVGLTIRQVADQTRLSVTLVGLLDRRLVRSASIPGEVIDALAAALQVQAATVAQYLQQEPTFAPSASFRATTAPEMPSTQDFAEAVRHDPSVDDNRRAELLRLSPPASR